MILFVRVIQTTGLKISCELSKDEGKLLSIAAHRYLQELQAYLSSFEALGPKLPAEKGHSNNSKQAQWREQHI